MATESLGVVRVARQVLLTIVTHTALQIPGVTRMAHRGDSWSRFLNREIPRQGVALTVKDNIVSVDLYLVLAAGVNIVEVGTAVQQEVASALEEIVGMQVREVNVYVQDVDAIYQKALGAGGKSLREPQTMFYGDRSAGVQDKAGNQWWFATHVEDVPPQEMEQRMKEWEAQQQQG